MPSVDEGAELIMPASASAGAVPVLIPLELVFQGSSADEYTGTGVLMSLFFRGMKEETEGWRDSRSREGSGSVFCEDSAATCSIEISVFAIR